MEHIPQNDIVPILKECHRLLRKGGIISLTIDYLDHWSYFDQNVSAYNFLKYSEQEWRKYNPALHYQNRLRHKDYFTAISQTDFEIVENHPKMPLEEDLGGLNRMKIAPIFHNNYSIEELAVKSSSIILRKKA